MARTRVAQWMLFEQGRIEAELAYARFLKLSGRHERLPEVYANRLERGIDALVAVDRGLSDGREFVAGDYSIADIALYAYIHCADEAGADLAAHEHIAAVAPPRGGAAAVRQRSRAAPGTRLRSGPSEASGRAQRSARTRTSPTVTSGEPSTRSAALSRTQAAARRADSATASAVSPTVTEAAVPSPPSIT